MIVMMKRSALVALMSIVLAGVWSVAAGQQPGAYGGFDGVDAFLEHYEAQSRDEQQALWRDRKSVV